MANNIQQQVNALESKGLPALQQMQKLDPKMLVGVAIDNLEQGLKEDQRAKQMGGGNVGPSVIDKKLMGLGGLGLGQQEALTAARPGTQMRGQQMQASQLAQAMQQAQKRPAGGIASMPMMRNQMQRMADGGVVGLRGGGLAEIGTNAKGPIPSMTPEQLEYVRKMGDLRKSINNPANTPEQKQRALQELQNYQRDVPVGIQEAVDVMMRGPVKMPKMQAGGAVKKYAGPEGSQVISDTNPETGLPYSPEEFEAFLNFAEIQNRRNSDTMVDASRLPNRLTPAQESERDLAIIEQAREAQEAQARRDRDKARRRFEETQEAFAGVPSTDTDPLTRAEVATMNERLASNVNPELRDEQQFAALRAQYPIMDPEFGLDDLADYTIGKTGEFLGSDIVRKLREVDAERQQERAERAQNQREAAEIQRRRAGELARLEAGLTPEQKADRALRQGRPQELFFPKTDEEEKSRAGLQPEKTPMSDKIFSLLQTLGDFSGAPKGYEGATFLARRRAREEAAADRQARTDLLEREMEGRFDLMQEQERLRSQEAREIALAGYAGDLTDLDIQGDAEFMRRAQELKEMYEPGFFGIGGDEAKLQAELVNLYNETRARKLREMSGYLGLDKTAQTEPEFDYSNYNPNARQ